MDISLSLLRFLIRSRKCGPTEATIPGIRRNRLLAAVIAGWTIALAPMAARAASVRCGWLDNPSPGNASLHDKDGEWTIAVQGEYQANGDWPPAFRPGRWISRGPGSYGYGCACLTVELDPAEKKFLTILSGQTRPLSVCRKDSAIARIERQLR
jgi:hypothetical protein